MSIAKAIENLATDSGEIRDTIEYEKQDKLGYRENVRVGIYKFSGELFKFKDGSKGLLTKFGFFKVSKRTR